MPAKQIKDLNPAGSVVATDKLAVDHADNTTEYVTAALLAAYILNNANLTGTFSIGGTQITASAAELNYVDGVTSAIQAQIDGKAATVHTHTLAQISDAGALAAKNTIDSAALVTNGVITEAKLDAALQVKVNNSQFSVFNKTAPPTVNDDGANTSGNGTFSVGSVWIDITNDEAYRCVDATTGAAVWIETTLETGELGTMAVQNSNAVNITGGTVAAATLPIGSDVQAWDALLDDIAALTDPNADRGIFWDDSAGELKWLQYGTGLGITDTTLGLTGGKQTIFVPASAMLPATTNGCAALAQVEISSSQPELLTLDFDASTQEYAIFGLAMPKSWNRSTLTFKAYWSHASTTTNFGTAWSLEAVAMGDDDAIGASYGTAITVTDTGGTTNDQYISAESGALTVGGSPGSDNEMVYFRVSRVTGDGSDTMAIDARLAGVAIFLTTNAGTDD